MIFEEAARDYIGRSKETADVESELDHADVQSLSEFARFFYNKGAKDAKLRDELNKVYSPPQFHHHLRKK